MRVMSAMRVMRVMRVLSVVRVMSVILSLSKDGPGNSVGDMISRPSFDRLRMTFHRLRMTA
jgi:hypothetical protein